MFKKVTIVHDHFTRQADEFRIPKWNTELKKRAISIQGAEIWNNTPNDIKNSCSLNTLIYALKKHLIMTL